MHIDTIDTENYTQLPRQIIIFPDCHLYYLCEFAMQITRALYFYLIGSIQKLHIFYEPSQ